MSTTTTTDPSTYLNLPLLTSPDFSPYTHANSLIHSTNNPTDATTDLTTPLSRVLFDLQEIDTHIHTLTSRSALPILQYTSTQNAAASRILARVEDERSRLNDSYVRLEREVLARAEAAEKAKREAQHSWAALRLGRGVSRVLALARTFETTVTEAGLGGGGRAGREDHKALLRACYAVLSFRDLMASQEGGDLTRINVVKTVRGRIFEDGEARTLDFARRVVREFSVSSLTSTGQAAQTTFNEAQEAKARFESAVHMLYLLSPAPRIDARRMTKEEFDAEYLVRSLQGYLQGAVTASSGGIARGLAQLPALERALAETSTRCMNVVALEVLLKGIRRVGHPLLAEQKRDEGENEEEEVDLDKLDLGDRDTAEDNLLDPLLHALDTSSLPSYFWRSLASSLGPRVQDIMNRGGVSARTLKSNKEMVRNEVRECVLRGSRLAGGVLGGGEGGKEEVLGNWEREAAVMVGSVMGALGR